VRRLIAALALALSCCTDAEELRLQDAEAIARSGGLAPRMLMADGLRILGFERPGPPNGILTVYIEGDGRAWLNPWRPSTDPTPADPVGLRLAAADPARPLLYLARPCQYVSVEGCDSRLWTSARLSPTVVDLFRHLIDEALQRSGNDRVGLIGYSGGGALAALIAERRRDVAWLVTVAADLDLGEWVRLQEIAPLSESLDPVRDAGAIGRLRQVHLVGSDDRVVPPAVAQSFVRRLPEGSPARIVVVPGFDHQCCWAAAWPRLLGELDLGVADRRPVERP
jgi:pimeloyl-ACP methyl ester carboxylesterase